MTLVEKYALLPAEIDRQSLAMVAESLRANAAAARLPDAERYVLQRIVRAEGDPAIADDTRSAPMRWRAPWPRCGRPDG